MIFIEYISLYLHIYMFLSCLYNAITANLLADLWNVFPNNMIQQDNTLNFLWRIWILFTSKTSNNEKLIMLRIIITKNHTQHIFYTFNMNLIYLWAWFNMTMRHKVWPSFVCNIRKSDRVIRIKRHSISQKTKIDLNKKCSKVIKKKMQALSK